VAPALMKVYGLEPWMVKNILKLQILKSILAPNAWPPIKALRRPHFTRLLPFDRLASPASPTTSFGCKIEALSRPHEKGLKDRSANLFLHKLHVHERAQSCMCMSGHRAEGTELMCMSGHRAEGKGWASPPCNGASMMLS
jgi:hypothetical protein